MSAEDAEISMEMARNPSNPVGFFMDINLRGISGLSCKKVLSQQREKHHIVVAVISATASLKDINLSKKGGLKTYFSNVFNVLLRKNITQIKSYNQNIIL